MLGKPQKELPSIYECYLKTSLNPDAIASIMTPASHPMSAGVQSEAMNQSYYGVASTLDKYWEQKQERSRDQALDAAKREYLQTS